MNIFLTTGAVTLLLLSGCASGILSMSQSTATNISSPENTGTNDNAIITTYISGVPHSQMISYESGTHLKELFSKLAAANAHDPYSAETKQLQRQILVFAEEQGLLPQGMSADKILDQLGRRNQSFAPQSISGGSSVYTAGIGREMFCNFVATGEGAAFPIIILPRFIPFVMAPIPRLFVSWKTPLGVTSCGGLLSGTGFYAVGPQQGFALGFWGIGFSIFLPPVMAYGMFGYALFAKATAEYMEYYPPNNPPQIMQTDPADGQQNVPLTTTELRFQISDIDGDLMSYNVTTSPDIGSGSGGLKPDGTYSIPIHGLEDLTQYTWQITLTDGKDTVSQTQHFTTVAQAPIVSDVYPPDGDNAVPIDIPALHFYIKDYQGDPISYTVTTIPNIGSGSGSNVHDGTITIPVHDVAIATTYHWYVNATDGTHWTRKVFQFQTTYPSQFNPFDYGWHYRKMLTINSADVDETVQNFPVLVSTIDNDLKIKAQPDGNDILFMDATGYAQKLYFEIEQYQDSSGALTAWVNIPVLGPSQTTTFYMYYGNPDCLTIQDKIHTWGNHYLMVQHLNQASFDLLKDSTQYHNDIVSQAGNPLYQQPGKMGYGIGFDGSSGLNFASPIDNTAPVTIEAWSKPTSVNGAHYIFCNGGETSHSYGFYWYINNGMFGATIMNLPLFCGQEGITAAVSGQWSYCASTWDGTTNAGHFVINGQVFTKDSGYDSRNTPARNAKIGSCTAGSYEFQGCIDELHISDVARDIGWLTTCYKNQNNPSDFISIGPEEGL